MATRWSLYSKNLKLLLGMFKIIKNSEKSDGRIGELETNHGKFNTPVFMPPGTRAAVKAMGPEDLEDIGIEILLVNALHLYLQPSESVISGIGGIHKFMAWQKPILSDSGGFQAWSFGKKEGKKLSVIADEGIKFYSPLDGSSHFITPEKSIEIQYKLGADIIMAFDECSPDTNDREYAEKSMARTHRWAVRSLKKHQELSKKREDKGKTPPLIFGIIQGGIFKDLREESAKFITSLPFDGFALGGETIGYNIPRTLEILAWIKNYLPKDSPRYTMGLGASLYDIIEVVKRGVDMFDCVAPARLARHGSLYNGKIRLEKGGVAIESEFPDKILKINNSCFRNDPLPIDEECDCSTCRNFSRAYLRHLYASKESLYLKLATIHNLRFVRRLIEALRENV